MYSSPCHCWKSTQGRQTDGQTEAESIAMTHNALVPGTNVLVIVGGVHQETDGQTDRGKKHSNDSQYT